MRAPPPYSRAGKARGKRQKAKMNATFSHTFAFWPFASKELKLRSGLYLGRFPKMRLRRKSVLHAKPPHKLAKPLRVFSAQVRAGGVTLLVAIGKLRKLPLEKWIELLLRARCQEQGRGGNRCGATGGCGFE